MWHIVFLFYIFLTQPVEATLSKDYERCSGTAFEVIAKELRSTRAQIDVEMVSNVSTAASNFVTGETVLAVCLSGICGFT